MLLPALLMFDANFDSVPDYGILDDYFKDNYSLFVLAECIDVYIYV